MEFIFADFNCMHNLTKQKREDISTNTKQETDYTIMMKMTKQGKTVKFLCLVCMLFVAGQTKSQVTFGSTEKTEDGALLQLKNIDNVTDGSANATKGLGLPRVALTDLKKLEPCAKTSTEASSHVGLMVFNTTPEICPGVFVWDGEKWEKVPDDRKTVVSSDVSTNVYIVRPKDILEFPVTKVYNVLQDATWGTDLNTTALSTDPAKWDAKLIWQELPDMIKEVSIIRNTTSPQNSMIKVVTKQGGCIEGNAIVAVTVDGVVRWSWHIWVADYKPDRKVYPFTNTAGTTSEFMSRNLGATSETPGDWKSIGTVYQWGRKDPFPGRRNWTANTTDSDGYTEIVDINNNPIITDKVNNPFGVLRSQTEVTLATAIQTPQIYYYRTASGNWNSVPTGQENKYNGLWNNDTATKSIFDPCPTGWRVPRWIGTTNTSSAWSGMNKTDGLTWQYGVDFNNSTYSANNKIGYYPASGSRMVESTATSTNGSYGYWWLAQGLKVTDAKGKIKDGARFMEIGLNPAIYIQPEKSNPDRGHAFSIRCMKE